MQTVPPHEIQHHKALLASPWLVTRWSNATPEFPGPMTQAVFLGYLKHLFFGLVQPKSIFIATFDLFTTVFTAQMGRGKLHCVYCSISPFFLRYTVGTQQLVSFFRQRHFLKSSHSEIKWKSNFWRYLLLRTKTTRRTKTMRWYTYTRTLGSFVSRTALIHVH